MTLVLFVVIILAMVLSSKTVSKTQVRQDLIEDASLDIGSYVFNAEDIQQIKYLMTKEVSGEKGFRDLYLPLAVHIENTYVTGDFYIDLFYEEVDGSWQLEDSYRVDDDLSFKSEIDAALLQTIIKDNYNYMTVEEIQIESVDIDDERLKQYVEASLIINDGMIRAQEKVGLTISYGKAWDETYLWQVEDYDVFESEETLIAGVDEEYLTEILTGIDIDDWTDSYEDGIYISDPLQIKSLEIKEQETDLENFSDHVVVGISLAYENMTVKGDLDLSCYYDQGYGWILDDFTAIGEATAEVLQAFDLSENEVRNDLYRVTYDYSFFKSVKIEENNLMEFKMEGISYSEQGMEANVAIDFNVFDRDKIIITKAIMQYELQEGEWLFMNISKEGALKTMDVSEYQKTLSPIIVEQVQASSVREPMGQYTYGAEHLLDNDVNTAWVEGSADEGKGEWVEFIFESEENLQMIEFYLGYQSNRDRYYKNLRPVKLKIIYSNGEESTYEASDERDAQYLYFASSKKVKSIKVVIDETTGTDSYLDTCISDINFYSRP